MTLRLSQTAACCRLHITCKHVAVYTVSCLINWLLYVLNRDSFDDLLPLATNSRPDTDDSLSKQPAADGEQWTAVNRR